MACVYTVIFINDVLGIYERYSGLLNMANGQYVSCDAIQYKIIQYDDNSLMDFLQDLAAHFNTRVVEKIINHTVYSVRYVMLYGYLYSASRRRLFRGALSVTGR